MKYGIVVILNGLDLPFKMPFIRLVLIVILTMFANLLKQLKMIVGGITDHVVTVYGHAI